MQTQHFRTPGVARPFSRTEPGAGRLSAETPLHARATTSIVRRAGTKESPVSLSISARERTLFMTEAKASDAIVRYELSDKVARITLARPPVNALSLDMIRAVVAAVRRA